ncbi:MAG TPA: hypothetical protein VF210_12750 [Pseudomonadales bacterium]
MGLVAREIERRGIATICLSSAYSITEAVNPPRAVFVDFPLGHTAGKRGDKPLQRRILIDTLSALDSIQQPGTIRKLPYRWSASDDWKTAPPLTDERQERSSEPQYQYPEDRDAAEGSGATS